MSNSKYRDKVIIRKRMMFIFALLILAFIGLVIKMGTIMIGQSPELKEKAVDQWTSEVKIDAKRGRILDRNGNELAVSANVYRVDLDMNTLRSTMEEKKLSKNDVASKTFKSIRYGTKRSRKSIE